MHLRGSGADICAGCGMVSIFQYTTGDNGSYSLLSYRDFARPLDAWRIFTATSMIGFIAGAGIVVRNSIILVDFIELRLKEGMPLDLAVIDAGAVRFRPMM